MVPAILAKKIGMTRIFDEQGRSVPVTVVQAGPCKVLQVRNCENDGYDAVQLGFEDRKPHRSTLPIIGHCAKADSAPKRFIREVRLDQATDRKAGDVITVEVFEEAGVKFVDVVGTSKGFGFQGVMKRHGFGGLSASHGTERKHRSPGSISSHGTDLGHGGNIKKGKRMAGQMGNVRRTARNQQLIAVNKDEGLLLIRGGLPGPNGGYLLVRQAKTKT